MQDPTSSGDILADRRYAYAHALREEGDLQAAADLALQAVEIAPGWAAGWFFLGEVREAQHRATSEPAEAQELRHEAVSAYERARALDPQDHLGAAVRLAALDAADPGAAMSPAYVRRLFDDYAPRFDRHLVEGLKYRAPELIVAALRRVTGPHVGRLRLGAVLDLGCGTGLMARALEGAAERIEGVDLSPGMLRQAARTRLYGRLDEGDLLEHLRRRDPESFDAVIAADVFVYLADLAPVFREARRVLRRGGLFAFTVQAHGGRGVVLGEDGRYAHSEESLREEGGGSGLEVALLDAVSTRQDRGRDVPGLLAVLRRGRGVTR